MTSIELTVTDWQGIEGVVIAKHEDSSLWDFEIVSADLTDCEELEFSPTWKQVEREFDSSDAMPYVLPISHLLYLSDNY